MLSLLKTIQKLRPKSTFSILLILLKTISQKSNKSLMLLSKLTQVKQWFFKSWNKLESGLMLISSRSNLMKLITKELLMKTSSKEWNSIPIQKLPMKISSPGRMSILEELEKKKPKIETQMLTRDWQVNNGSETSGRVKEKISKLLNNKKRIDYKPKSKILVISEEETAVTAKTSENIFTFFNFPHKNRNMDMESKNYIYHYMRTL